MGAEGQENRGQAATKPAGKAIVLFSDGTGNSSAKLFKTNVWRMYEAVDLGPSAEDRRDQISFYDDGVGTSGFKPLAALGGAFGWGLKRNVLDLYRYACRNYEPGDQIYGFGFSRGAFTMRLVIALIASQGLVRSGDEAELERRSRCAYRAFRADFVPRKFKWLTVRLRRLRDRWTARRERRRKITPYSRKDNRDPVIRFLGVWDTVAAYGGPIAEITRAIDNWIYPLSMPDYELNPKVKCARHALSLDDERDAFHPLLWDELAEQRKAEGAREGRRAALEAAEAAAKAGNIRRAERATRVAARCADRERHFGERMEQVWFTGMHSDVGGGYPDESLSYVSLLWMMEEAEKADLRTLDAIKNRYFALANSYGPKHDSRSGLGAYYRYQPRKIAAWLDPPDDRYLMLRDPDIRDTLTNAEHGLLCRVLVHESVIARTDTGTDRYAPIALPEKFEVVPPQQEGEKIEQADSEEKDEEKKEAAAARPPSEPLIQPPARVRLARAAGPRFQCQENLWDLVWKRRLAYFATLAVTLMLAALPLWNPLFFFEQTCSDDRCVLPSLIRSANVMVPGFAEGWIEAVADYPVTAIILIAAIAALLRWGRRIECRLRDQSYRLWRTALDGRPIAADRCTPTRIRKAREGKLYQRLARIVKWYVLPGLFGLLMLAGILYVPLVGLTQVSLFYGEPAHVFCPPDESGMRRPLGRADFIFDTRLPCVTPVLSVEKHQVYEVVFQLPVSDKNQPAPWWDRDMPSDAGALTRVRARSFFQLLGMPMRRVIEGSYLQPLAQVTVMDDRAGRGRRALPALVQPWLPDFDTVYVSELDLRQDEDWPELYRARFTADETGTLQLYANEAQLPFGWGRRFYDNNCGVARVTIIHVLPRRKGHPPQDLMAEPGDPVTLPDCASQRLKEAEED